MSRYRGPRLRIVRRLGDLPGLTTKTISKSVPLRQYGKPAKKMSQYGVRLREKQKVRFNYGITESQLVRYVQQARSGKGSTGELLLQLLEMRLDNIVFRLGMTPTISSARQLIQHGHILVNGVRATIPSYQCKVKDVITPSSKKQSRAIVSQFVEKRVETRKMILIPSHLTFTPENGEGIVKGVVDRQRIPLKVNELLIVEYYSRKL